MEITTTERSRNFLERYLSIEATDHGGLSHEGNLVFAVCPNTVDAIKERDIDALEALMCNNIKENVEDLPEKIGELMDAIDGEIIESSWEHRGGSYQESDGEGKAIVQAGLDIYFTTSTGTYDIGIVWETVNTFAPEETGIRDIALCDPDLLYTDNFVLAKISATEGIGEWHD